MNTQGPWHIFRAGPLPWWGGGVEGGVEVARVEG